MSFNAIEEYYQYMKTPLHHDARTPFDRYDVFLEISKQFSISKVLYPGSYIHITPSMIFREVIYVDNAKKAKPFFNHKPEILEFIEEKKIYNEKSIIQFESKDYREPLSIPNGYCELLISQFAGFVSQACKKYLGEGGFLLANDSHGDATLAKMDHDFNFIGVLTYDNGHYRFNAEDLDQYFTFKRDRPIDIDKVLKTMKGPRYKTPSDYYLFQKTKG
ncbi:MAG TPA: hypothetical protein P5107_10025 [Thermotogota bacterium]|nr:hypothetical protein [Thermotogota bacterium]